MSNRTTRIYGAVELGGSHSPSALGHGNMTWGEGGQAGQVGQVADKADGLPGVMSIVDDTVRIEAGQCTLNLVETRVGSAWFKLLKLNYDKLVSRFAFKVNWRHYNEGRTELRGSFATGDGGIQLGVTAADAIDVRGTIRGRTALSFGGAADDDNKISLVVEEPQSEWRTIVLPDASGRLVVGPARKCSKTYLTGAPGPGAFYYTRKRLFLSLPLLLISGKRHFTPEMTVSTRAEGRFEHFLADPEWWCRRRRRCPSPQRARWFWTLLK